MISCRLLNLRNLVSLAMLACTVTNVYGQNLCFPEPQMTFGLGSDLSSFNGVGAAAANGQGFYWVDTDNNLNWNRLSSPCGSQRLVNGTSLMPITDVKVWSDGVYIAAPPNVWVFSYVNRSLTQVAGPFSPDFHSITLTPTKALGPFLFVADRGAGCVRAVYANGSYDNVGGCGGDVRFQRFSAPSWVFVSPLSVTSVPALYILDGAQLWVITPLKTGGSVLNITSIDGVAVNLLYMGKALEERYAYGAAATSSPGALQCGVFRVDLTADPLVPELVTPLSPCPLRPRQFTFLGNGTVVMLIDRVADPRVADAMFGLDCSGFDSFVPTTPFVDPMPCTGTFVPATTPPSPAPLPSPPTPAPAPSGRNSATIVIAVVVSAVGVFIVGTVVLCLCIRRTSPILPEDGADDGTRLQAPKDSTTTAPTVGGTLVASHIAVELSDTLPAQHSQSLSLTQRASSAFEASEAESDTTTKLPRSLVSDGSMAIDEGEDVEERQLIRIGEFTKVKLLGRGAYGSVYSCLLGNGRTIAMKEMMLNHQDFCTIVSDVEREVEVMRQIRHPNVVHYIGARCDREHCTITVFMELVSGGSLGSMIRGLKEPMPERTVQKLMREAAQGLAFIHSKGVIHRDMKGDNMLLTADGVVKLADFGTAKQVGMGTGASRGAQTMIGTPYYMAPELLLEGDNGEIGYGIKADVWSFGITVGELLNHGVPPWPTFSNPGQAFLHIAGAGNLPVIPPTATPTARDFILYCCRRDPKERPTSAMLLEHPWLRDL